MQQKTSNLQNKLTEGQIQKKLFAIVKKNLLEKSLQQSQQLS